MVKYACPQFFIPEKDGSFSGSFLDLKVCIHVRFFRRQPIPSPKADCTVCGNTLWAFRASFEIRRLRRLSRGSADPREYSRSWRLVQSCPAHVAANGAVCFRASPYRPDTLLHSFYKNNEPNSQKYVLNHVTDSSESISADIHLFPVPA